jgi:hypothetical protein
MVAKKATPAKKGAAKSAKLNSAAKKRAERTPGEGFNTAMKKVAKKAAPKKSS